MAEMRRCYLGTVFKYSSTQVSVQSSGSRSDFLEEQTLGGWRRLGFVLEAIAVIPIGTLIALLPWKLGRPLGRLAGTVLFHLNKNGRELAYHNLDVVFSDSPLLQDEKERIVRNLFINLARSASNSSISAT